MLLDHLLPGDTVDIIAPSSKCHPSVLNKFQEWLQSWNLQCHIPEDLFGDSFLYANSDEKRFAHLEYALLNKQSKVVWCLLGGFGASKIIPMLSNIRPPQQSKIFIGFSDITALHIFLQGEWGWSTIHGPSAYQIALNKIASESVNLLKEMLFHPEKNLSYTNIIPLNELAKNKQTISAKLIGGNLHLIQASLGTSWQINAADKILFIEEINERAYRIDRILTQLNQAKIISQTKAILFGDMIDSGEPDGKFLVKKIIQEFAHHCPVPVLQISNVGHGMVNNPILLGSTAQLQLGDFYSLEF